MGRFEKEIILESGIDRRESGYYSTPNFIAKFMFEMCLDINPNGKLALDPCVGQEELIKDFHNFDIAVDGIDILDHGDYYYCNFQKNDFILAYEEHKSGGLFSRNPLGTNYDYIIANPPYNCHEVNFIKENKKKLLNLFPAVGVHNMYSMFISAIVDIAKDGAVISLIVSDSFLTATAHQPLREQILKNCSVHYLILCPSDLFRDQKADVRTCILILQKGTEYQHLVKTLNRPSNKAALHQKLENREFETVKLSSIVSSPEKGKELVVGISKEVHALFSYPKLGQLFKCITGISTGNDKLYISKEKKQGFSIPFYKNPGSHKFSCEPNAFLTDDYLKLDREIKDFMVRNKTYMLQSGITCSSMGVTFSACYLPAGATFGVNANIFGDEEELWWLLAYLNSSLVTYIVRGILCRSNMITSGYVSRIPIVSFSNDTKNKLVDLSLEAFKLKNDLNSITQIISKIDEIIFSELNFSDDLVEDIKHFSQNLQLRV